MEHFPLVDRLHTDVLEEKYGPIKAKVLKHSKELREAHLVDNMGVSRTYSLTFFPNKKETRIANVEKEISKGFPIGKAFRKHGYAIRKNVVEVFIFKLTSKLKKEFKTTEKNAKARISEFYAKKRGDEPVVYGLVLEIYSPDFRPAVINAVDKIQDNAFTEALLNNGFSKEEIWQRIGNENYWGDVKARYMKAKKESRAVESIFKKKIMNYINN
ncbi:MAG: hypothetical protein AABW79_00790 [Nanoarchaeota archaeon]